ncbi:MAG: isocitrate/isopropylmalate dehydrogenase family protein [Pirellulales bacterium]
MPHRVTLIPGDGIGPEVTAAARRVIDVSGVDVQWQVCLAGAKVFEQTGEALPPEVLESITENRVALKGPITTPSGSGYRSVNVRLRQTLDLYANFRPAKSFTGVRSRYEDVDLIVIRENTEGLYSGLEHVVVPGVVESLRIVTEKASRRVVRFAFETALRYGRKRVTAVHKANILKKSDGLFLDVAAEVAREYPQIEFDECIVDAAAMKLVLDPHQFDVLVMENLFGDIISDLTSGLVGGLGLTPSGNIGERAAVFEAVHGTAPDIAGQGKANPSALLMSGVLMLRHLNEHEAATRIETALRGVIAEGKVLTGDLGGRASTDEFTDAVIDALG